MLLAAGLVFCLVTSAFAHGGIYTYEINGVQYQGNPHHLDTSNTTREAQISSIQRSWWYEPIYNFSSPNMTCNFDGHPASIHPHGSITAGQNISVTWNARKFDPDWSKLSQGIYSIPFWPHYYGPLLAYLARCPGSSCDGWNGQGAVWFKIAQAGVNTSAPWKKTKNAVTGATEIYPQWYQETLNGGWNVTIPESLKSGSYLIRHEAIVFDGVEGPVEAFPNCAQLVVSGNGRSLPASEQLVAFPGAYTGKGEFFCLFMAR
ncbi:putative cellulose-growth-specific protein [Halenospora varia]|nr:putative cellulose-growth-specific protein [Halenospora varia]